MTVVGLQQNANWWSHINVVETLPVGEGVVTVRLAPREIVTVSVKLAGR